MKLFSALLVVALAIGSAMGGNRVCKQADNSSNVESFHKKSIKVNMPCKYNAVLQNCGGHTIRVTPGYIASGTMYRLNTVWLSVTVNDKKWEGRTTNKLMVKFLNGDISQLFIQKNQNDSDSLPTAGLLKFNVTRYGGLRRGRVTMEDVFRLDVTPWDPSNRNLYSRSTWVFECLASGDFEINPYPEQVCGGDTDAGFKYNKVPKGQLTGDQLLLLNVFNDTKYITQTDEKCLEAEDIIQNRCKHDNQREEAIVTCGQILTDKNRRVCVTRYSCTPMDIFVHCIDWVCGNYLNDTLCEKVGAAIDMCRNFGDGNLTQKVDNEKCYKEFLQIDVSKDKKGHDNSTSGSEHHGDSTNDTATRPTATKGNGGVFNV